MAQSCQPPLTPEKQLTTSRLDLDLDSPTMDDLDCTPNTKAEMRSKKRQASQIFGQGSPKTPSSFLKWRFSVVEQELEVKEMERKALLEANTFYKKIGKSKQELIAVVDEEEKNLLSEKKVLLSNRHILLQDMSDIVDSRTHLQEAYIKELRLAFAVASRSNQTSRGLKAPRYDRKPFREAVDKYLGTERVSDSGDVDRWCNVLGYWLPFSIKCAHIVPYSWDNKHLAHMFGSDEPPLTSERNGLSLQNKIEEAFDNCWIAIVPANSVESNPIEWKVVLLNTAERDKVFYTDNHKLTDRRVWRWGDIDGRKLSFCNDNRPARRFLYMRYTLAWLHADDNTWPGFKEKVPPGRVWASPKKPDGYLRKSILLALGKKTGDRLPTDLVNAGVFEDPETSSRVLDELTRMKITECVKDYLAGKRDTKDKEEEEEEEEEEEDDEDEYPDEGRRLSSVEREANGGFDRDDPGTPGSSADSEDEGSD